MYLFVYGTLLSSVPSSMSKFLRRRATLLGAATVNGTLYDLGMYPGFTTGGGRVRGEVYELEPVREEETLSMLDAYEGVTGEPQDEYVREPIGATLGNGRNVTAITYRSRRLPGDASPIKTGDYARFYAHSKAHQRFVNGG